MELKLTGIRKHFGEKEVLRGAASRSSKARSTACWGATAQANHIVQLPDGRVPPDGGTANLCWTTAHAAPWHDDVGYVLATPILPDFLTGYEFRRFIWTSMLHVFGTDAPPMIISTWWIAPEDRHRLIKGYSHGMKNKVQMLCFLIARPPVILLDEPLTSFDVVVALEIKQLLRQIKHEHIIVFSTHILQLATDLCDEIAVLHEGMLSQLDHALLHSGDFEAQLIELLKDEGEA
ncbi:MAG: ABC transporter ATP-binding protein [Ruthenibacterium lactatiformans]